MMPSDLPEFEKELQELKDLYSSDPRQQAFNCLLLGEYGSGKTFSLRTARKPVFIDSWDPGGTKCLKKWIASGDIVVDTRWEGDDPTNPSKFKAWYPTFLKRVKSGFFSNFGTYCLDSSTTWGMAVLSSYLKKSGNPGAIPDYKKHYHYQMFDIRTYIRKMLDLECDFILTGHLELKQDGEGGKLKYVYATTGKGTYIIPSLFDEVYVATTNETSKGVEYKFLTRRIGRYAARSRLAADGLLETYEEPDFKVILKKAGYSTEDKPKLKF